MTISLDPIVEERLRARAESSGLSVERYLERIIQDEESAEEELERLALEGLNSGEGVVADANYWAERRAELKRRSALTAAASWRGHSSHPKQVTEYSHATGLE